MLTRFCIPISRQSRQISTKQPKIKLKVKMDEETNKMIEADELKPRKHAGRMSTKVAELPGWLPETLNRALEDTPLKPLFADGIKLSNYLHSRTLPPQESVIQAKYTAIREQLAATRKFEKVARFSAETLEKQEHYTTLRIMKRTVKMWAPVEYNKYASLLYLVSRGAQDYAVLYKIFGEIAARDKEFKPTSMFDFGSGVGTAIWAASELWPNSIQEHMCVDVSTDMNDLSGFLISQADPPIKGVFYRQFSPLSNRSYDIVVNAYSLLELPNMQTRLETISKLWAKTKNYLVIVEQGTNAGFQVVNEAREFILHLKQAREESNPQAAHVFSPCPHDLACPRYNDREDNTPCNFPVTYKPLPLKNLQKPDVERFSYVVLKKGERSEELENWPRIVRPTLVRSKHVICRICTTNGKLDEIIFTASKHGKPMYRCAKSSKWGDRLPLEIMDEEENQEEAQEQQENDENQEEAQQEEQENQEEAHKEEVEIQQQQKKEQQENQEEAQKEEVEKQQQQQKKETET